ncbi:hypothetical protein K6Y81_14695 [Burkholderia cenocepacia]|nr:hypothetical protein [Burkholderia cenocepacia]
MRRCRAYHRTSWIACAGVPARRRRDVESARGLHGRSLHPVTGLHTYPQGKRTPDGEQHAINAGCSMIGNDNEALLSAARVGLGILARGDCLMMQDIDTGNPTSGLPCRCRLTPAR